MSGITDIADKIRQESCYQKLHEKYGHLTTEQLITQQLTIFGSCASGRATLVFLSDMGVPMNRILPSIRPENPGTDKALVQHLRQHPGKPVVSTPLPTKAAPLHPQQFERPAAKPKSTGWLPALFSDAAPV